MIQTKQYENGLRLIFEKNEKSVVSTSICFNVGSQDESIGEEGFSHFVEHMIFKGTRTMGAVEIMDKLTFLGADFNAFTSKLATKFVFKCLDENFEKCFEIFSDMLINAEFDENELNKERQVVIEEMKRSEDEPTDVMYRRAMENFFDGLSYAHDELGTEELIENVSRKQILEYKKKYYRSEYCVISIVGNLELDDVDEIVKKYFSDYFNYIAEPVKQNFEPFPINIKNKYDIIERNDNQANVCIVIKSVTSADKDKHVCDLYTSILGSSQNSRLFKIIREEMGLVYTIYAYNEMSPKTGAIIIAFGTRPKNVERAMTEIKKAIRDFAEKGATEEELKRAKNWKKSCLSFGMETNSNLAEINGTMFNVFGKIFDKEERLEKIQGVTLEDINNFAKRISEEQAYNVVAVGKNIKKEEISVF